MQLLEFLSQSSLILWVAESNYGYPIVLTLHSIGMALVVGIMLVADLRVLGVASAIPFPMIKKFFTFAWIGLAINAGSGTLLFLANYSAFLSNTAFISKMVMLFAGAIATFFLTKSLDKVGSINGQAKSLAFFCLMLWLGAITAGRIVGYTSVPM